jgi:hypothetical protein
MTVRFVRTLVAIGFAVIALGRPCAAQTDAAQPQVVTTVILLKIATDKTRYKVGEPILVRSTIYNASNTTYDVFSGFATEMVALTIRDAAGNTVAPDHYPRRRGFPISPVGVPLAGGASRSIGGLDREEWVHLADWGYGSLPPGRYTLTGVLSARVFRVMGDGQNEKVIERFATSDETGKGAIASTSLDIVP